MWHIHKCIFLRIHEGKLTHTTVNELLRAGKKVSLETLDDVFSVKILDHEPPLPYMMGLIWSQIIARRAADMPGYQRCSVKHPLAVTIRVDDVIEELHNGFTFNSIHSGDSNHQPKLPQRKWVQKACDAFVVFGMARWDEEDKGRISILFHRKLTDVHTHFVGLCCRQPIVKAIGAPIEQLSFVNMFGTQPCGQTAADTLPQAPDIPKETAGTANANANGQSEYNVEIRC